VPDNITLLPLPPKCPELNVMENVWQFMRDNWLSNRVFRDHDDIVHHYCHHWNRLIGQPWRIMSLGLRPWEHGFRSTGSGIRGHGRVPLLPNRFLVERHNHRRLCERQGDAQSAATPHPSNRSGIVPHDGYAVRGWSGST
jgi:hypothetical protein